MKLENGKRYIKRNGENTSHLHYDKDEDPFFYFDPNTMETWTEDGRYDDDHETPNDIIEEYITPPPENKAGTDKVGTGLTLIPLYSLLNLGKIFIEGLRYGKDNWKKGVNDKEYQEERLEHALLHLIKWKERDRSEEHLAKVAWFCFTQLELERLERDEIQI